MADTTKTATDATKNVPSTGDLTKPGDSALGGVGGRKPGGPEGAGSGDIVEKPKESSLKINIKLDIEVEIHLTARVKGDITIGLL